MDIKEIPNSPGYSISNTGVVYNNKNNKVMKTWLSTDGYVRVRLTSIRHGKRVNRTVHLLVTEAFMNSGKYVDDNELQINHKDGNKQNNKVNNLEVVTGTQNVNHAHNHGLYTYNIKITMFDLFTKSTRTYRSIRELSRALKVSMNYIRPRIRGSMRYPIGNRYILSMDYDNYVRHISTIKNNKRIYVYDHLTNKIITLTAYTQISILLGVSYINIGKRLYKYPDNEVYYAGYTFSLNPIIKPRPIASAPNDRSAVWKKLVMNDLIT